VIDRLVLAVIHADAAGKIRYGQILLSAYDERRWGNFEVLASGLFLLHSALAVGRARAREVAISSLYCTDAIEDERLDALENGSWMNTEEADAWRELIRSGAVTDDELFDRDLGSIWAVLEVTRSVRSRCCLAVIGQYGETSQLVTACSSRPEAMMVLRRRGYVGVADYAARALGG
jgi:hypothetical protein